MKYQPTIGLEVHAELSTKTKMFCDCPNDPFESHPNANVCPICLGHPGVLPTVNKKAIELMLKLGFALKARLNERFQFDRKNYFYPDLPKGYQLTQQSAPMIIGGEVGGVRIHHVHLEEDAGKLVHNEFSRPNDEQIKSNDNRTFGKDSISFDKNSSEGFSLVDFNRGGVPLMELVTDPDIHSPEAAVAFARELQQIFRYLGLSDADLEKGQMRFDANVSIRPNSAQIESNSDRIVLKDESYMLMGLLFEIHNKLGSVYKEKNYQDAIEAILNREKIIFEREKKITLKLDNLDVSNFFVDFVIDNKILLEIKTTQFITQEDIRQVLRYIKSANLPLGIIANFRKEQLEYKRVINPKFDEANSILLDNNSSDPPLGTKVEIKNLNSFKALELALNYEIKRQSELLEEGKEVAQETRGWNEPKQVTVSQRGKEHAHDYRYFPEPDLPPFELASIKDAGIDLKEIELSVPELPQEKRERFQKQYNLTGGQAALLAEERPMAQFFEETVSELEEENDKTASPEQVKLVFNYLTSDLRGLMAEFETDVLNMKITAENFADLVKLIAAGVISSRSAKDVLRKMMETGLDPREIVKQEGLEQVSGGSELEDTVRKILSENPAAIEDFKKGKTNALQFLIGKAMAQLKGRGNPEVLKKMFEEKL